MVIFRCLSLSTILKDRGLCLLGLVHPESCMGPLVDPRAREREKLHRALKMPPKMVAFVQMLSYSKSETRASHTNTTQHQTFKIWVLESEMLLPCLCCFAC